MTSFHESLIRDHAELIDRARNHPLASAVASATIPQERLHRWLCHEHLWGRDFERFLAKLAARAPTTIRRALFESLLNLYGHIDEFAELATKAGADLTRFHSSYAYHSSMSFLFATVQMRSFEEALAACYGVNLAAGEAWVRADETKPHRGPWQDLVDQRSQESFSLWIARLADFVDSSVHDGAPGIRPRMEESFRLSLLYTLRYWDGTLHGPDL